MQLKNANYLVFCKPHFIMRQLIISLFLILNIAIIKAQENSTQEIVDIFCKHYKNKNYKKGVEYLFSKSKKSLSASSKKLAKDYLITSFTHGAKSAGKFYDYKLFNKTTYSNSYKRVYYLLEHEKVPFLLSILFFKTKNDWKIKDCVYTSNIEEILKANNQ